MTFARKVEFSFIVSSIEKTYTFRVSFQGINSIAKALMNSSGFIEYGTVRF